MYISYIQWFFKIHILLPFNQYNFFFFKEENMGTCVMSVKISIMSVLTLILLNQLPSGDFI